MSGKTLNRYIDMSVEEKKITEGVAPLKCWDIFSIYLNTMNQRINNHDDIQYLLGLKSINEWDVDFLKILDSYYDALVLTDNSIQIQWVNKGFNRMTGYSSQEVIGRSPKMLQGEKTSIASRGFIREKLNGTRPFNTEVINYRKNGEEYLCQVAIYPLLNLEGNVSHFLALETKAA
ncbi:MAG: PAS domain-containing protein [Bacteroidota bacterium]